MKKTLLISAALLLGAMSCSQAPTAQNEEGRPFFNKEKDLLLAQFDSKPDPDDLHAQAALGSMMLHSDLDGVNIYAVSGAIGIQGGKFLDSKELFNMIFADRWTAANQDWDGAVSDIVDVVLPVLNNGGKVWVQEAGQSNITADWVSEILKTTTPANVKENVIVVQHSTWNEDQTDSTDLAYVKEMTNYFSIDDGNLLPTEHVGERGEYITPSYRAKDSTWIKIAKEAPNKEISRLWFVADSLIDYNFPDGFEHDWSYIHYDGVDYSDCVENWWILNIGETVDTHEKFWDRYVTK